MSDDGPTVDRLGRDTAVIAVLTAISRVTGFGRIVVSAAVLGTGLLGDVYQSANTVPNIVFELLAGGALQAALIPLFVGVRREGDDRRFARTVGLVGATVAASLAIVTLLFAVVSPLVARLLASAEPVASVADDKIALATWMLVVFAPQIVFYGLGLVSSAALQARRRFAAAAIAPAVNNVVVIAAYLLFGVLDDDSANSLELTALEIAVLAGGTTLGVVAFTSVPVVALRRATTSPMSPRVSFTDPVIRSVARTGGWAVVQVAGTLALTAGALVVGNGAPGGVAVFALTLAVFMLPYALVAAPVATAAMPRLAERHHHGDRAGFADLVRRSTVRVVWPSLLAAIGMAALAWPIARIVVFGAANERGPAPVAHALVAFAVGVVPYGLHQLATRVLISRGEVRAAAGVSIVTAVVGVVLMIAFSSSFADDERAAALALGHSLAHVAGLALLVPMVLRRIRPGAEREPSSGGAATGTVVQLVGPSTGGIRRHVAALVGDLRAAGWTVVVAAPAGVLDDAVEVDVPNGTSWSALHRARRQLRALLGDTSSPVVHAHGLKAGWVAIGVRNARVVLTVHNVVLDGGVRGWALRMLERRVVGRADAVLVTSREIAARFPTVADRLTVVPPVHAIDDVRRGRNEIRAELGATGPLVVTVARLHPQKDIDTLLAAFALVARDRPDVTLAVAGDGPERERLETLASGRVVFLGARDDAVDLIAASDVFVISSAWESGPLTLLEAASVGAAVVSTPVGFVPDVVVDGVSGRIVPIGGVVECAAAIMALVDDPARARAMGDALRRAAAVRLDRSASRDAAVRAYLGATTQGHAG